MAYDEKLAERVRRVLRRRKGIDVRKMFGGLAFLLNGNMCCGVVGKDLVLRLGEDLTTRALDEPYTREMDFTGKVLKSMVYVEPEGTRTDAALDRWVKKALGYGKTLPPKWS